MGIVVVVVVFSFSICQMFFNVITSYNERMCFPFIIFFSLSHLYAQHGTQTHTPEIKSRTLFQLSQPGVAFAYFFKEEISKLSIPFNSLVSDLGEQQRDSVWEGEQGHGLRR